MVNNYENLLVWQKAMDLVERVYFKTRVFPKDESYGITSQLRRAILSIPLNIAEGQGRESKKEFRRFLFISRGSAYETSTIFQMCLRLKYISQEEYQEFYCEINQIIKMLGGLIKRMEKHNVFPELRSQNSDFSVGQGSAPGGSSKSEAV